MKVILSFIIVFSSIVCSSAEEKVKSELRILQNVVRSGDKLVARAGEVNPAQQEDADSAIKEDIDYVISNFTVKKEHVHTTVTFNISVKGWLGVSSGNESGVYIYNGDSPTKAKLCAVSCIGGDVKIILDSFTVSDRWFFAGSRRKGSPIEILTK